MSLFFLVSILPSVFRLGIAILLWHTVGASGTCNITIINLCPIAATLETRPCVMAAAKRSPAREIRSSTVQLPTLIRSTQPLVQNLREIGWANLFHPLTSATFQKTYSYYQLLRLSGPCLHINTFILPKWSCWLLVVIVSIRYSVAQVIKNSKRLLLPPASSSEVCLDPHSLGNKDWCFVKELQCSTRVVILFPSDDYSWDWRCYVQEPQPWGGCLVPHRQNTAV